MLFLDIFSPAYEQVIVYNDFLGFQQVDTIEWWVPAFLFAVLFGLSMDYHVFLLSRIRERFHQTRDNTSSVAYGISSTGRLITGAALIMVGVFIGFASGDLVMFQQMGFGLAVAVLLDATIVRSVLVPATMKILGDKNWYMPSSLRWLPEFRTESAEVVTSVAYSPAKDLRSPITIMAEGIKCPQCFDDVVKPNSPMTTSSARTAARTAPVARIPPAGPAASTK